jgi:hypothetical protein
MRASRQSSSESPLEFDRISPYLVLQFALLSTATLFEAFDAAMLGFAAPDVRETFGIEVDDWRFAACTTRFGVMASFLFLIALDLFASSARPDAGISIARPPVEAARDARRDSTAWADARRTRGEGHEPGSLLSLPMARSATP